MVPRSLQFILFYSFSVRCISFINYCEVEQTSPKQFFCQHHATPYVLRFPFSFEIRKRCVLSGGTQRRALSRHQSDEIKIFNIYFGVARG